MNKHYFKKHKHINCVICNEFLEWKMNAKSVFKPHVVFLLQFRPDPHSFFSFWVIYWMLKWAGGGTEQHLSVWWGLWLSAAVNPFTETLSCASVLEPHAACEAGAILVYCSNMPSKLKDIWARSHCAMLNISNTKYDHHLCLCSPENSKNTVTAVLVLYISEQILWDAFICLPIK